MASEGINWKRTVDRFGWYITGLAIGCLLVGLMISAKRLYLRQPQPPQGVADAPTPTSAAPDGK